MRVNFRNDYSEVGHPKILERLIQHTSDLYLGYGEDEVTKELERKMQKLTKQNGHMYLLGGGTQTNLTMLSKMLTNYEAVLSTESGHIHVHETGAIEGSGHKIITVKGKNGKILPEEIEEVMHTYIDCHMVKPKVVYISNATEIGTIYQKEELKRLYKVCRQYHLFLFMDGARLPIALTSKENDLSLKEIADWTDAFYLGGTKNGLPYGEMLFIKDKELDIDFRYHLKNKGAMFAKTFVLSLLFDTYMENDFYLQLANHANFMAEYLRKGLKQSKVEFAYENSTNQLFIVLENRVVEKLEKYYDFEIWKKDKEKSTIRLVTSWNTSQQSCEAFLQTLKDELG